MKSALNMITIYAGKFLLTKLFHTYTRKVTKMQSKKKWIILLIILAAIAGAAFYFLYFIRTPAYALNQVRIAAQEHDTTKFSRYVDVHSVMDNAFEDIIKAESKINHDNIFSNPFALGILHMLKPSVVDLMSKEALDKVAAKKEETPQQPAADPVPDAMKRNMERHIPIGKLQVKDLQLTKHDGETATASIVLHDKDLDKDFVAELLMQHNEKGDWQIKKVSNLADIIVQLDAAKRAKQAALNKPILERLNKALQTTGERLTMNKQNTSSSDEANATLTATIMAKNMGTAQINRMYYDVMVLDENGKQLYSYPEHYQGSIAPGQAVELTTTKKLNALLPDDKKLMGMDISKEKIKIQVTYIAYDNGEVLSPNEYIE